LANKERDEVAACEFSGDRNGRTPSIHRGGAEASVRSGRGEMALDVETL
jgi:hypothetical protein